MQSADDAHEDPNKIAQNSAGMGLEGLASIQLFNEVIILFLTTARARPNLLAALCDKIGRTQGREDDASGCGCGARLLRSSDRPAALRPDPATGPEYRVAS